MDYFDREEEKQREREESVLYEKQYEKQAKVAKKVILITFGIIGGIFFVVGIFLLAFSVADETGFSVGFVFLPMGIFFLLLGIILYAVIPTKGNYERFKKNMNRFGYTNPIYLSAQNQLLESRISRLEEKNKSLEKRIEELERRR